MVRACAPLRLVAAAFLTVMALVLVLMANRPKTSNYFKMYADDMTIFEGAIRVNTLGRFLVIAMGLSLLNVMDSYVGTRVGAWRVNYLSDHKTPRSDISSSDLSIHFTLQIFSVYRTVVGIIGLWTSLTNVYFILISAYANIVVLYATTEEFLELKRKVFAKAC